MVSLEYLAVISLGGALAAAVTFDLRDRRIPNVLVAVLLGAGLSMQTVLFGLDGLEDALLGAGIGGLFLVPLYMGGGMGAGDVKLLAAVGSFFGFAGVISVLVCTLLVGGLLGIALITWRKTGPWFQFRFRGGDSTAASVAPGIPYAVAIAAGSMLVLLTAEPGLLPLMDMR